MKSKIQPTMKGIDNSSLGSPRVAGTTAKAKVSARPAPPSHRLVVAVHDAEREFREACQEVEDAELRAKESVIVHGDETWDFRQAVHDAMDVRDAAEARLREAKRDYSIEFGRSWDGK